jgi:hypothetical protein
MADLFPKYEKNTQTKRICLFYLPFNQPVAAKFPNFALSFKL